MPPLFDPTAAFIYAVSEFIYGIFKRLRISVDSGQVSLILEEKGKNSIDERIAKIDQARANLQDGLNAINELKKIAERNKREARTALQQIVQLEKDKELLQKEKEAVKNLVQADVEAFRKVAGVLSPSGIRKERVIGFITGVAASILASIVIGGFWILINYLFPKPQ